MALSTFTPVSTKQVHSPSTEPVSLKRGRNLGFPKTPLSSTTPRRFPHHSCFSLSTLHPPSDKSRPNCVLIYFLVKCSVRSAASDFLVLSRWVPGCCCCWCKNTLLDIQCTSPSAYYISSLPA